MAKFVYFFGNGKAEGRGDMKEVLGGKGAGLAEMTNIGLPVPAGFTISVPACEQYYANGRRMPKGLDVEVKANIKKLEKATGKKFGDPKDPLLVSVRSGAARSMPGMMETILNLGLTDVSVEGLAARTNNPRFAYDAYRRFIQMYSTTAMGLSKEPMEEMLHHMKERLSIKNDTDVPAEAWKELCEEFKKFYKEKTGKPFPQDTVEQLWGAIAAVFGSWEAEKAVTYRRVEKITDIQGTGVNVQQMVFGNKGENSGTGVAFTRDPNSGENIFFGDMLINAQGEDVVAGIRTPIKLSHLDEVMPKVAKQLNDTRKRLERHYKDMQDLEFTIEDGKLYMLQCRTGKRSPRATFVIAADLVKERLITKEEAVRRITPEDIERLFYPVIDPKIDKKELASKKIAEGINAVPGAAAGEVVFTAAEAEALAAKGNKVILVRKETSPEDVAGMHAAQGILTATGGKTSHAAVVARGWGKCCVVGVDALRIDYDKKQMKVGDRVIKQGDAITLDGSEGAVFLGSMPLVKPELPQAYYEVMKMADGIRRLGVRTNADNPYDAAKAVEMGAEGIGLCRTEHMFFETEARRDAIQEMIVADNEEERRKALAKLLPFQRDDFIGIFKAMGGRPVTIRLIDPPLHEFVPHDEPHQKALAQKIGKPFDVVKHRIEQLHEFNPMLGHRGCRLSITYPEIAEMQVRAIIEAAVQVKKEGLKVKPEIMHPLTLDAKEFGILEEISRRVAGEVMKAAGIKVDYLVGTMLEIPRAALLADEIAQKAEFFSFGTNDLTQMAMGLSRDDAGRFLPDYVNQGKAGVFAEDPFVSLDQHGVGKLVEMGVERGRASRPNIKLGVCGEHGGEAKSVKFFHRVGLDYVSCSPYRVPIARLAAAQAVVEEKLAAAKAKPAGKRAAKPAAKKAAKPAAKKVAQKASAAKATAKKAVKKIAKKGGARK
ncbi:MAG TPA: pyruvate, phosphate dikinase [Myxococcales bacterium]|nr:pyruvate, phosphate dikinase [Myxococcales bacterium]